MPTIHLSVPDHVYEKLKKAASVYNIQVTDLIKILIRSNLDDALEGRLGPGESAARLGELEARLEEMRREYDQALENIRQAVKTLSSMIVDLDRRLGNLEMDVEELKEAAGLTNVVIEPEILENTRR